MRRNNPAVWAENIERDAFKALENYRHAVTDENMHLKHQNADLRHRVGKLAEIEARIEGLLLRDEHNVREIESLRMLNHTERLKVEELHGYLDMERSTKIEIEQTLKAEIQDLSERLRWAAADTDQIRLEYESMINDIKASTAREIQSFKMEIMDVQHQNRMQIDALSDALRLKSVELEQKETEWTSTRRAMLEDLQNFKIELERMQRDSLILNEENRSLAKQSAELKQGLESVKANNETLMMEKIKADQQRAQLLLDVTDSQKRMDHVLTDIHSLERALSEKSTRLAECEAINLDQRAKLKELENLLDMKERCIDDLRMEMLAREESSTKDLAKFSLMNAELEDVISRLKTQQLATDKKIPALENELFNKTAEIKDLLYGIERLEEKLLEFESKNRGLEYGSLDLQEKVSILNQEIENLRLDKRTLQDKITLKESHIIDLQNLLKKEEAARQSKEIELIELRKAAANPQKIIEKYEEEMLRMINLFQQEKELNQEQWNQEKKRLREIYDYELKDMQELYQRKLRVLQS